MQDHHWPCNIRIITKHCYSLNFCEVRRAGRKECMCNAWKVQCNCGIIYNFCFVEAKRRKEAEWEENMQIRWMNAYRAIWDGQCFQRNGTMKEMLSSLWVADIVVFSFSLLLVLLAIESPSEMDLKAIDCFPVHCEQHQSHLNRNASRFFCVSHFCTDINRRIRHRNYKLQNHFGSIFFTLNLNVFRSIWRTFLSTSD